VTELVLFGTKGKLRTSQTGRRMVNFIATMKERHSKKPQELYDMIELCSPAPFLELFAREVRAGWTHWGDEVPTVRGNGIAREKVSPRPMEDGMIRPYRMPQLPLFMPGQLAADPRGRHKKPA
jgi:N6-adenosine-specific RNA methylase IME4